MISINRLNLTSKKRNLENQNVSWWINFVLNSDFEFSLTNKNTTHHTSFDKSLISFRNGDVYCDWNCNLFYKDDVFCDWNCIALQRWCVLRLKLYRSTKMVCFATETVSLHKDGAFCDWTVSFYKDDAFCGWTVSFYKDDAFCDWNSIFL